MFSGLSATVGDPDKFNNWLASVQRAHGFKHTFIHHPHRYSHLRKFYYLIRDPLEEATDLEGLSKHVSSDRMRFLHPASVLSFGSRALPPDLSFEGRDTLTLYQALEEVPNILTVAERERLRPSNFFPSSRPLRQEDVLGYESELKRVVGSLMSATGAEVDDDAPFLALTKRLTDPHIGRMDNEQLNTLPNGKEFLRNLLGFLCDLHAQGDLVSVLPGFITIRSHHFNVTLRSPHFFSASIVPRVKRLSTVSSQSSKKPRTSGERPLPNGWKKCARTRPGMPERNNARSRRNVLGSNDHPKGMARKISHPRLRGRHHSTLQSLPGTSVLPGTSSVFRRKIWIRRSLVLPNGAEWTNALSQP